MKIGSEDFGKTTLLRMQKALGLGYFDVMSPPRKPADAQTAFRIAFYEQQYREHMAARAKWCAAIANALFGVWIDELTPK